MVATGFAVERAMRQEVSPDVVNQDELLSSPLPVDVVHPVPGGLPREIVQTGNIESWESVNLHARVSGYIETIDVEIGDAVEANQVLATIDAVELRKDVEKSNALLAQAKSRVAQAEARLETTLAEHRAAQGAVDRAAAEVVRADADTDLMEKQLDRLRKLIEQGAVEQDLGDEKQREVQAARAGGTAARAAELVAKSEMEAIGSRVQLAKADIVAAEADVRVSEADLERAQVLEGYTRIIAPYEAIVTARGFDRGDYVLANGSESDTSVITIARNDRMRAVARIPAADAPFVSVGNPVAVSIDSLGDRVFHSRIARFSRSLDQRTRTMRAEIDLENTGCYLSGGMYGSIKISVPAHSDHLTLPMDCFVGPIVNGHAKVYVVDEDRMKLRTIAVGRSNEERAEVLSGVEESEAVICLGTDESADLEDGRLTVIRNDSGSSLKLGSATDLGVVKAAEDKPLAAATGTQPN